ncbi:MAG: hypothetical protein NWF04_09590 [Candidatus Bathyarchaeota archaeon]|nr:hypothetical protein [Candidatus Bathyarchaeota archaeon]
MELGAYFQILIGVLMTCTFASLALIFLKAHYNSEEESQRED